MKHRTARTRKALYTFRGGMFLAGILFIALLAGCPNAGMTPEAPSYTTVAFGELDTWLQGKLDGGPYYIEVTDLTADDLKSYFTSASPLGRILKNNHTKQVALKLPESVEGLTSMEASFYGCSSLVSVNAIPSGVTSMFRCFTACSSLTQGPEIPSDVTDMRYCFYNCSGLTQAPAIPSGVTNMDSCFYGCSGLTQAPAIPANVNNMSYCFYGCSGLTQAPEIPAGVNDMSYCFMDCSNLMQAPAIPANVTNMNLCFYDCSSLTQAPAIPSNVTNMSYCFYGCSSLTQGPEIPSDVTDMVSCFYRCTALAGVTLRCNYTAFPNGDFTDAFSGCTALPDGGIKVPSGQLTTYQAHATDMGTTQVKFAAIP